MIVAAEGLGVGDRADRGDRVERPREAAPVGDVLERRERGCARQHERGDRADQQRDAGAGRTSSRGARQRGPGRSPTRVWKRSEIRVAGIPSPGSRTGLSNGTARRPGSCARETAAPAGPPARAGAEASSGRTTAALSARSSTARSRPNGPPTTKQRSARAMRRSSSKLGQRLARQRLALAVERADVGPARDPPQDRLGLVRPLRELDLLEARMAAQQPLRSGPRRPRTAGGPCRRRSTTSRTVRY